MSTSLPSRSPSSGVSLVAKAGDYLRDHGRSFVVLLYSMLMEFVAPLLKIAALFKPKLREQLKGRPRVHDLARELAKPRATKRHCVVFFCSSAGEFEQARPLTQRLQARGDVFVHVIFFSRAGWEFARARSETLSYSLAPAVDSVWSWGYLFSALRPDIVAVVRHELWPAFLESASQFAELHLLDASRSVGEETSDWKKLARATLLGYFDTIYAVSEDDARFFRDEHKLPASKLVVVGDTKYDRVRERAAAGPLSSLTPLLTARDGGTKRLVLGSAHLPDVDLWLAAWKKLGAETTGWQVVLVPHMVDADNIGSIAARCKAQGLTTTLYSSLEAGRADVSQGHAAVIIVDRMGVLAEVYGTADLAFVGGAVHHRVHNVLEPASHRLPIAFGQNYTNSQEARYFVSREAAQACADEEAFAAWWRRHRDDAKDSPYRQRLGAEVEQLSGAAERIFGDWSATLQRVSLPHA